MVLRQKRIPVAYAGTGWYIAAILALGIVAQEFGRDTILLADVFRWVTVGMLVVGSLLAFRNVWVVRHSPHGFVILLSVLNYVGMATVVVLKMLQFLGERPSPYLGVSFALVGIGLWCFVLMTRHAGEIGIQPRDS